MSTSCFHLGPRWVDLAAQTVTDPRSDAGPLSLTELEARLLDRLRQADGALVPKRVLLREVWGYADGVESRAVDYTLRRLRKKLEDAPRAPVHLVSTYGSGVGLRGAEADVPEPETCDDRPPLPLDTFVGRAAACDRLARWIDEGARVVVILGAGGIGKTRLVREWSRQLNPAELTWVSLRSGADGPGLQRSVAGTLGLDGADPLPGLTQHSGVLVLDGAEACAAELETTLPRWLRAAESLRVVVTSRVPLSGPGTQPLRLPPLSTDAATRLYAARAAACGALHPLDDPQITELVNLLEGNPLAIELAAARAGVRPVSELIDALAHPLDTLAAVDAPERSLRAVVGWSWSLLNGRQQAVLAACSTFPGRFGRGAAEVAAGADAVDVLNELHHRSLVYAPPGRRRTFSLPMGVRAFAAERLSKAAQHTIEDRLAEWVLHRTGEGRRPPQRAWIIDELAFLRALLRRLRRRGAPTTIPLATAIAPTLADRGWQAEALQPLAEWGDAPGLPAVVRAMVLAMGGALEQARQVLEPSRAATDPRIRCAAHLVGASIHLRQTALASADSELNAAEAILLHHPDPIDHARLHTGRSVACRLRGQSAQALVHGQACVTAWTELDDAAGQAAGQFEVAMALRGLGRLDDARTALHAALSYAESVGAMRKAATLHVNMGVVHAELGARRLAHHHYRRGLELHRRTGNLQGEGYAWLNLASIAFWDHDLTQAEQALLEARGIARKVGDPRITAHADGVEGIGSFVTGGCTHPALRSARHLLERARFALTAAGAGRTASWYATYEGLTQVLLADAGPPPDGMASPLLVQCAAAMADSRWTEARALLSGVPARERDTEDGRYLVQWLTTHLDGGGLPAVRPHA